MTADVPVVEVVAVDAVLDGLDTPTSSEVYSAVEPFSNAAVAAAAAARAIAGGGGATPTLAAVLTESGDPAGHPVTGQLELTPSSTTEAPLLITPPAGFEANQSDLILGTYAGGNNAAFEARLSDASGGGSTMIVSNPDATKQVHVQSNTGVFVVGSGSLLALYTDSFGGRVAQIDGTVGVLITAHAAPADGDISAGEMCIWFDQTNGAAKLMIKAKTANGTVVTGNVALA